MPMLLARREPYHVTRSDFLDWPALPLHPAAAEGDDQRLTQWMGVPCGACPWLEGYGIAGGPRRSIGLEQRIDPHRACKPVGRSLTGWLRTASLDLHDVFPLLIPRRVRRATCRARSSSPARCR